LHCRCPRLTRLGRRRSRRWGKRRCFLKKRTRLRQRRPRRHRKRTRRCQLPTRLWEKRVRRCRRRACFWERRTRFCGKLTRRRGRRTRLYKKRTGFFKRLTRFFQLWTRFLKKRVQCRLRLNDLCKKRLFDPRSRPKCCFLNTCEFRVWDFCRAIFKRWQKRWSAPVLWRFGPGDFPKRRGFFFQGEANE